MTLPNVMAKIGGFVLAFWIICSLLLAFFTYFEAVNDVTTDMITYNPEADNGLPPKDQAKFIVENKGDLDYGFFSHLFCCNGIKRQMQA